MPYGRDLASTCKLSPPLRRAITTRGDGALPRWPALADTSLTPKRRRVRDARRRPVKDPGPGEPAHLLKTAAAGAEGPATIRQDLNQARNDGQVPIRLERLHRQHPHAAQRQPPAGMGGTPPRPGLRGDSPRQIHRRRAVPRLRQPLDVRPARSRELGWSPARSGSHRPEAVHDDADARDQRDGPTTARSGEDPGGSRPDPDRPRRDTTLARRLRQREHPHPARGLEQPTRPGRRRRLRRRPRPDHHRGGPCDRGTPHP